jgi:DNA-binding transcriptional LysR family regulator
MALLMRADGKLAAWRRADLQTLRLAAEHDARPVAARLIAAFCAGHPGVQVSLRLAERGELLSRFARGLDDVYLFELDPDALPVGRRWSVVHSKGSSLAAAAALFLRDALASGELAGGILQQSPGGGSELGLPPAVKIRR